LYRAAYFRSTIHHNGCGRGLYTLTFSVEMPFMDDDVFLAHCFPYTTADLHAFFASLQLDPQRSCYVQHSSLCTTVGGRDVPLLTITHPSSSFETPGEGDGRRAEGDDTWRNNQEKPIEERRVVFISARVHPGETPASWLMHGILQFLTSTNEEVAARLRKEIVFKILPMFNPDGVVEGNSRTSLLGDDLNRCWANPDRVRQPEIYYAKKMLSDLPKAAALFLDLHAHSMRPDCFLYGCGAPLARTRKTEEEPAARGHAAAAAPPPPSQPDALIPQRTLQDVFTRVFPRILAGNCQAFVYSSCHFHTRKGKEGCARVVAHRELRIEAAYTIEASFLGGTRCFLFRGPYEARH